MATSTLQDEILEFFNSVTDPYEIRYRIKDDPNFGSAPASGYGIGLSVANNILARRATLPGGVFKRIQQIDNAPGVGPVTLHNILYSFSESMRAWTASSDRQHIGTMRNVGVGTMKPEDKFQVFDGALSVKSYLDEPEQKALLNSVFAGKPNDVYVQGKYAYLAEVSQFTIVDISEPSQPFYVADPVPLNDARGIFVESDYAYVADGTDGLKIFDISNSANPTLISTIGTTGEALGVFIVGDFAYVTDGDGLQIIDVTDPINPVLGPRYDTPGSAEDVYVAGNYAFVADGSKGLLLLDISDPINPPFLVSSFDTDGDCRSVYVHADRAFVADGSKGFLILNISNPMKLVRVGSIDTPAGQADDIYVVGSHAFVANGVSGFLVFDIGDLFEPKLVDTFKVVNGDARGVFVSDRFAYLADRNNGLLVYRIMSNSKISADSSFCGKVGIGTMAANEKLTIDGNIDMVGNDRRIFMGSSGSTFGVAYDDDYPDHGIFYTDGSPDYVSISPNGDSQNGTLNVHGNGKVGIGTNQPQAKLHVHAGTYGEEACGLLLTRDGNGPFMRINDRGRILSLQYYNQSVFLISDGSGGPMGRVHINGHFSYTNNDFAEFFENHEEEAILPGTSVVMENGKVRKARTEETPVGVITANPGITGGVHFEWPKKYLQDEYGRHVMEDHQIEVMAPKKNGDGTPVLDPNGETIMVGTGTFETVRGPVLNPEFDAGKGYVPRQERPEWSCVGLLGQLPVLKGQPVAANWFKIKEISNELDLWFVR